ncbi:DUF6745 domain-containing protein [Deinococcus sp.]|uniref:DUF6745 domain-containing protein n=1 Tax=Deinococcus sp. TaxID=47478 RepID=UPI0025D9C2ED|nr:hypothetical protein [Deinococcus sp.]
MPDVLDAPAAIPPVLSAAEARAAILGGQVSGPLRFRGKLDLSGEKGLRHLPDDLCGDTLDVSDSGLEALPERLSLGELIARNLPLTGVPSSLRVQFRLSLDGCARLQELPENLVVGALNLQDCLSLETLPEGLDVYFLNIDRCDAMTRWPRQAQMRFGHLSARDCLSLRSLPGWLGTVAQLDISGCRGIVALPAHLKITGWLDVAGSGLENLSSLLGPHPALRWRGVRVDERLAFDPQSIRGSEIMAQTNAEVRRVMIERVGAERFLDEVGAVILDRDRDAGGERTLVQVNMDNDEPFVAVCVGCPSTGRRYTLRVPPTIRTGQAASAWLAGFDDPKLYRPVVEA